MKRVVFCDFDGTITVAETFVGMLELFAPQIAAELLPEMYSLRLSLREGVPLMAKTIPSQSYPEILKYVSSQQIRSGLTELIDFLDAEGVPLVVVSGGFRGMVEAALGSLVDRVHAIHAADVDTSDTYLRIYSNYEEGTQLVSKVQVMQLYQAEQSIAIGDSLTDLEMGMHASIVFARDRLAKYLEERQKSYIPWDDFHDVIKHLQKLWH